MAVRQTVPTQGSIAAALLLAALMAAPAFAASDIDSRCDQVSDPNLLITVHELDAEAVSHDVEANASDDAEAKAPSKYLAPQVEATLRRVFEDPSRPLAESVPENADEPIASETDGEERVMKTRVPGVTDSELERYRRQMYRIDI